VNVDEVTVSGLVEEIAPPPAAPPAELMVAGEFAVQLLNVDEVMVSGPPWDSIAPPCSAVQLLKVDEVMVRGP
jgi:hypothetical protein